MTQLITSANLKKTPPVFFEQQLTQSHNRFGFFWISPNKKKKRRGRLQRNTTDCLATKRIGKNNLNTHGFNLITRKTQPRRWTTASNLTHLFNEMLFCWQIASVEKNGIIYMWWIRSYQVTSYNPSVSYKSPVSSYNPSVTDKVRYIMLMAEILHQFIGSLSMLYHYL